MPSSRAPAHQVKGIYFRTHKLDKIIAQMPRQGGALVSLLAHDVEATATSNTSRVASGAMRAGWKAIKIGPLRWRVQNSEFYAFFHEFGTTRIAAGPMLGPAIRAARRLLRVEAKALFKP